jgi:hypothetical protein
MNTPIVIELTPNGKTLACFYHRCPAMLIARMLHVMGDPELVSCGEDNPDVVWLLWPHQDMPVPLKQAAEDMSTANLLHFLGYYGGDHEG